MYGTLLPKIETTLNKCNKLADIKNYPVEEFGSYPTAMYFPVNSNNEYWSNEENRKEYRFSIFIVQEMNVRSRKEAINTVLANAVDQVQEQFDEDWDQGTLDGHRIFWTLTNGNWFFSEEDTGRMVTAELTLKADLITNN